MQLMGSQASDQDLNLQEEENPQNQKLIRISEIHVSEPLARCLEICDINTNTNGTSYCPFKSLMKRLELYLFHNKQQVAFLTNVTYLIKVRSQRHNIVAARALYFLLQIFHCLFLFSTRENALVIQDFSQFELSLFRQL